VPKQNREQTRDQKIVQWIRSRSQQGQLTKTAELLQETEIPSRELLNKELEALASKGTATDLQWIDGQDERYFFSTKTMVPGYAAILARQEDRDLAGMIADTVRNDSKTYPRPTPIRVFQREPFRLAEDELADVLEQMKRQEEYADIQRITASTGAAYLFSEDYLKPVRARTMVKLAEEIEDE